jgi:beta-RFAP synthase
LVEAGKRADEALAPLVARLDFPPEWRIVLTLPPTKAGLHGCEERGAFERLRHNHADESRTDRLCRLVLLGLIPALMNRDYEAFGEALYEFNRRAGEPFTEVQGGIYRHRQIAEMIEFLRRKGALGAGQSSWGPAVFGIVPDVGQADLLARRLQDDFSLSEREVLVTSACNQGATCIAKG